MAEISPTADLSPSKPTPTGDLRIPLGVGVIAGVLLVAGTCSLVDLTLDWWTGRGLRLDLGPAVAFVGWGLLRRREWARMWATIFALPPMVAGGALVLLLPFADPSDLQLAPAFAAAAPWLRKLIGWLMALVVFGASVWVFRYLQQQRPANWFLEEDPLPRLIEWNPRHWRFGLGTLMLLTVLVVLATLSGLRHSGVREMRARQWTAYVNLNDPLYFPAGAKPIPIEALGSRSRHSKYGSAATVTYRMQLPQSTSMEPELLFVIFETGQSGTFEHHSGPGYEEEAFRLAGGDHIHFPGPIQLAEVVDGRLRTSDMHITLLEFWSYWNHPDVEWLLDGLERHVKDLRRRVAERDAGP